MQASSVIMLVITALIVGFGVGFFVGGKHRDRVLKAAGIIKGTTEDIAAALKAAGKKL